MKQYIVKDFNGEIDLLSIYPDTLLVGQHFADEFRSMFPDAIEIKMDNKQDLVEVQIEDAVLAEMLKAKAKRLFITPDEAIAVAIGSYLAKQ